MVVVGVGLYQLTPLKNACLRFCRSEAGMSVNGVGQHGLHCAGCCWALMMLFVGGVMNPGWVAALTVFVVAEKMLPQRLVLPRATGVALILFGTVARLGFAS